MPDETSSSSKDNPFLPNSSPSGSYDGINLQPDANKKLQGIWSLGTTTKIPNEPTEAVFISHKAGVATLVVERKPARGDSLKRHHIQLKDERSKRHFRLFYESTSDLKKLPQGEKTQKLRDDELERILHQVQKREKYAAASSANKRDAKGKYRSTKRNAKFRARDASQSLTERVAPLFSTKKTTLLSSKKEEKTNNNVEEFEMHLDDSNDDTVEDDEYNPFDDSGPCGRYR